MEAQRISVIIPVKNGATTLRPCLQSIRGQTIGRETEIIVLDSMSADNSRQIARSFGALVIEVPEGHFNHGLTRNEGVKHATGSLVYLTVQDARIPQNDMLEKMAAHFNDEKVMAVSGHQAVPHEKDKNPLIWYRPYSAPQVIERFAANAEAFKNIPVKEQQSLISWDNVVAMYRKSALLEQPFVKTAFAEDWIWSYHAMLKGWKLLYDSSIVVYHYHHNTFRYAFNSAYTVNYHFYKFFKYIPKLPSLLVFNARAIYQLGKNKKLSLKERLYWIMHNWSGRTANYFSTVDFLIRLKMGGEKAVEKGYNKYCKAIPQGKQKAG